MARGAAKAIAHRGLVVKGPPKGYAKYGAVALVELLHGLIERVFGEGVAAGGQHDDGLFALYIFQAIHGFEERVEEVRFAESREIEMIEPLHDFVFVLREVHFDAGLHVERLQRDPVFRLQTGEKRGGPILSDVGKKTTVAAAAELQEQDHGD